MRPPDFPIDTPAKVTAAREYLGMDKTQLGIALRIGTQNARQTIRRLEQGNHTRGIPGPTQLALERLVGAAATIEAVRVKHGTGSPQHRAAARAYGWEDGL